ncbi:hypothetical protein IMZ38_03810 [Thermosphaera chiliense]|uniref:Uncharacterized protein n=1 Tax=Thermosphaera chiliense TaxID=3402707 RepID=A0A7M1URX0_9CREN|nr:hypothetical protein [Thermosphaera aggregans]QOR95030.1 hypothetical protein IMZ38_03810 [Thermosphaera aggregans]
MVSDALEVLHNPSFKHATKQLNGRTKVALAVYVALRSRNICISPRCLEAWVTGGRNLFTYVLKALGLPGCEPLDYVIYASKKLRLDPSVAGNAVWIVLRLLDRFSSTRLKVDHPVRALSRSALAAGALYESGLVTGKKVFEKDLATVFCISEVSVRNAVKYVRECLKDEVRTWVEKAGREETERITAEASEGALFFKLAAQGESCAVIVFREPSGDEWERLARAVGLPVKGSIQLLDIVNTGSVDYKDLALEKSLAYLAAVKGLGLGDYGFVWCENQALTRILVNKGFRVAGLDPWGKKPVLVMDLNLLCSTPFA